MQEVRFSVRLLSAGPFVTMIDRFAVAPVLIPIAVDFHASVGAVAIAATAYYLAYGLAQPFWGFASDRVGRIKVIRISLAATAAACTLTAVAPNLDFLIAARIIAGASVCAVLPTALVYIGDVIPFNRRHAVIADVLAAVAIGTAAGSLGGGLFAHYLSWRLIFAVTAVLAALPRRCHGPLAGVGHAAVNRRSLRAAAAGGAPAVGAVPDPLRDTRGRDGARLSRVLRARPRVDRDERRSSGLVVATYGATVLAGTRVVKRVASRIPAWVPVSVGGAMGVVGYLVAAADQHVVAILLASVMIGGCYAIFHSTMQAWATDIAPEVRGTAAALFVTSAFTGGAIGSGLGALFAQQHQYGRLFLAAAALSVPVVIIAALTRARYPGSTLPEQVGEVAGS